MTVKIAVIGGGSSMFVPGLVRSLIQIPCFDGTQLTLMDTDAGRAAVMRDLGTPARGGGELRPGGHRDH